MGEMTNRIEYLDALRGFVMLLVVLGHVPMYCYHNTAGGLSFCLVGSTFHLALFFFIAGWFGGNSLRFTVNSLLLIVYSLRFRVYGLEYTV